MTWERAEQRMGQMVRVMVPCSVEKLRGRDLGSELV